MDAHATKIQAEPRAADCGASSLSLRVALAAIVSLLGFFCPQLGDVLCASLWST